MLRLPRGKLLSGRMVLELRVERVVKPSTSPLSSFGVGIFQWFYIFQASQFGGEMWRDL